MSQNGLKSREERGKREIDALESHERLIKRGVRMGMCDARRGETRRRRGGKQVEATC